MTNLNTIWNLRVQILEPFGVFSTSGWLISRKSIKNGVKKEPKFITEPKDHHVETRCYIKDPDGYIIEVGEATGMLEMMED